jgi:hypothetical protein
MACDGFRSRGSATLPTTIDRHEMGRVPASARPESNARHLLPVFLILFTLWIFAHPVSALQNASEPTVSATLSDTQTRVNDAVTLTVTVTNARVARPPAVAADGLTINFAGTSTQTQIFNSESSSSTVFTYIVTPTKTGTLEIPPVEVAVGGKTYRTERLTLKVDGEQQDNSSHAGGERYFGELVVPKDSAYVGEQVPIELRFYFDQRVSFQPYPQGQYPLIEGDGYVTKKYTEPAEKQLQLKGKFYHVLVYKTALTGVKPGKLDLESASQQFLISAPFGSRSIPGFGDPLDDFYQQRVVNIKTNNTSIQIKPLPAAGRPQTFSGAVGDFTISCAATPNKTKTGSPVDLRVEVRGLGNFDRMESPSITGAEGWRVYGPSSETQTLDDVGLSAVKTFRYSLVPEKSALETPNVQFSYFDPKQEKYITLNSPIPKILVEGETLPQIAQPPEPVASATPQRAPPRSAPFDVLDIHPKKEASAQFLPLVQQPIFWIAQTIPLGILALIGFGTWFKQTRATNLPARVLRQEKRTLWQKVNSSKDRSEVLNAAIRLLELKTAVPSGSQKGNGFLEEAVSSANLPSDIRSGLQELIHTRVAAVYGHIGHGSLSEEERNRIRDLLQRWEAA